MIGVIKLKEPLAKTHPFIYSAYLGLSKVALGGAPPPLVLRGLTKIFRSFLA
jgi:hypothetical protein